MLIVCEKLSRKMYKQFFWYFVDLSMYFVKVRNNFIHSIIEIIINIFLENF